MLSRSLTLNLVTTILVFAQSVSSLWPIPRTLQSGTTALKLSPGFEFKVDIPEPPADLLEAVVQAKTYLLTDNLGRLVVGRGSSDLPSLSNASSLPGLTLTLTTASPVLSISEESVADLTTRDESYELNVPADGSPATLTANTTLGLYRGLTTFGQLWYSYGGEIYTIEAPLWTLDSPAYPFRGFMLDTARNYFPVSDILRTLDAMSWAKINTFHWHVVDSQSFPLQVTAFPELSAMGAYAPTEIYSPTDVQDIIAYAAARGIDVLLEIDTPGHTTSIGYSHPEYIACNIASPWATFANEPPAGQLRFADPAVTNFTSELFTSVAQTLPSKFFSTGGDELNVECYVDDVLTQQILNATGRTLEEALDLFTRTTHGALEALGKTPVVWEEMVLDHNVTLSNNTVVMVWISSADAAAVAAKNFRIVHAPSDYFYLDCGAGEWISDDPTGNSWCDPFKTWQETYTFDPLANLTESQYPLVLGGEQLLWTEQSDPQNVDSIVWPRAAVSAEIFWTGATLPDGSPRNGTTALPRLHDLRFRMVQRGVRAIPLQPYWCALRPNECDLYA